MHANFYDSVLLENNMVAWNIRDNDNNDDNDRGNSGYSSDDALKKSRSGGTAAVQGHGITTQYYSGVLARTTSGSLRL